MKPLSDFIACMVGKKGQGTLADEIGVDGAELSKFRSGQGRLPLAALDALLDKNYALSLPRSEWRRQEELLAEMSRKWITLYEETVKNGRGSRKDERE